MPERETKRPAPASARALWSGTITFGLVSIPVDLFPAVHARATAMHMVDREGRPLGLQYYCPKHKKVLTRNDLVRGVETKDGRYVAVADEELEAIAPEMSRDIELQRFVPLQQIAPKYFDHPYVLTPAGRSLKAYYLLAKVLSKSGRSGIGTFVMRGHQYMVAILSHGFELRAQTLRFADALRSAAQIGLPKPTQGKTASVRRLAAAIESDTTRGSLDTSDMSDRYAKALHRLAQKKAKEGQDVVAAASDREGEEEATEVDAIALMERLQKSLRATKRKRGSSVAGRPTTQGQLRASLRK